MSVWAICLSGAGVIVAMLSSMLFYDNEVTGTLFGTSMLFIGVILMAMLTKERQP